MAHKPQTRLHARLSIEIISLRRLLSDQGGDTGYNLGDLPQNTQPAIAGVSRENSSYRWLRRTG
jgi:hypothetical protein